MATSEDSCSHSTVSSAVEEGCVECLTRHLNSGAAVDGMNCLGWRPLHVAAHENHLACLRLLVEQGHSDVNWTSFEKQTALIVAAREHHVEVCRALLDYGADVNLQDIFGSTALMMAVQAGYHDLAELLCQRGADLSLIDCTHDMPLIMATAIDDDQEMFQLLLRYGADPTQLNDVGFNILMSMLNDNYMAFFDAVVDILKDVCNEKTFKRIINHRNTITDTVIMDDLTQPHFNKVSPLCAAAKREVSGPLRKLLEVGADPNMSVRGGLAIFWSLEGAGENFKLLVPPVTDLACLAAARCSGLYSAGVVIDRERADGSRVRHDNMIAPWRRDLCILTATAISDTESHRHCGQDRNVGDECCGHRLKLLLDSGLDSIINHRLSVNFDSANPYKMDSYPDLMNWGQLPGAPRGLKQMFGDFMTPLTRMILDEVNLTNIKVMLSYGASWKPSYSTLEYSTVPFHFFMTDPALIELVARYGFTLNIYHPDYTFNLTILACFLAPLKLRTLLRMGTECQSCFVPRSDVSADAWSFQRFLQWFKNAKRLRSTRNFEQDFIVLSQCCTSKRMYESLSVLLEFCVLPFGAEVCNWVQELVEDSEHKAELMSTLSSVSTLQHICRVKIRTLLGSIVNVEKALSDDLCLPRELKEYLLFL